MRGRPPVPSGSRGPDIALVTSAVPTMTTGWRHGVLGLVDQQVVRFAMVGALNSVFGFCVFAGLQLAMGARVHYLVTLVMCHVLNVLEAYVLQRWLVFQVKGRWWSDLARFWSVYLVALAVSMVALTFLVEVARVSVLPAYLIVMLGVALATFLAHRTFTFRRAGDETSQPPVVARGIPSESRTVVPNLGTGGRVAGHFATGFFRGRSGIPALPVGGPSATTLQLQALFARSFVSSSLLRRKLKNAGDVADFVEWQIDRFGTPRIHSRREDLWEGLIRRLDPSEPLTVLEFGVAWGYSTQWWLQRLDNPDVVWHGFDRFTGLPRAWRGLGAGAFDADGNPPPISDDRLRWHIGDVEEKLPELSTHDLERSRRLVLFDLDIYEPTALAWSSLAPYLRAGDLLYFDEAMDDDERKVLDELVLPTGAVEYIGATASALALVVTRPIPPLS